MMNIFPAHDPVLIFAIVMSAVLIAPLLAEKLRLPGIIGLIFFGIILGPHVSNVLERDRTIELLGTIGLLYIMFQAGLEINLEEIKKNKHHSVLFGLITFSIPLVLGTLAGHYLLKMNIAASILLASMFSSHTLLTFPIVSNMGLAKKRSVAATIGGTIITDTLAFVILAVIIAINKGELTLIFWFKLIVYSIIYVFVISFFLPRITSWFFRRFFSDSGVEDYVFVITALFISAYFSHLIGLEPIIGAFLAGITLNPLIPEKGVLMNRIQFVGNSLFIPFFLISVGMLIDPVVLVTNIDAIKVTAVMVVIALISKDLAARSFSKLANFSGNERGLIFGMSVNQAAATLAAVLVGYRIGIFQEDVLAGTIMMIIVTSFCGSILTQKYTRRLVLDEEKSQDFSSQKSLERILIPISKPDNVSSLMDFAFLLHPKTSQEPLYPLHIVHDRGNIEHKIMNGESILTKASIRANTLQKSVIPINKIDYNIPSAILKAVNEQRISKIVLGWNKKTQFKKTIFDKTTEQLTKYSHQMIFITNLVKPLSIMNRIILIVPPFINKQNGFLDTIDSLKKLGTAVSADWFIISEEETFNEIKYLFAKQKGRVQHHFIQSWKNIINEIKAIIKPTDMILQLLSRRDRIAWRLIFEQMPKQLYNSFENNNLIIVYPYFNTDEQQVVTSDKLTLEECKLLELVPAYHILFNVQDSDPVNVFKRLIQNHFEKDQEAILRQITDVLLDYPLELTSDIVLIHTRTELIDDYQIFIAVSKTGFSFEKIKDKHKIMIILFSPESKSAQSHLNILSQISRLVTMDNFIKYILSSNDFETFNELMKACHQP